MTNDNAPEENAAIAKVACGTLELVKIIKVTNLCHSLEYLKKQGFWIIGFDSEAKETFSRHLIYSKVAVVLGSENKGLRRLTMKTCDILAKIAMTDKVESLNVSNAASIIFHSLYNIKQ
jgi:23S rRNA (guanosine2251-2'-O)-methyltransferase